jgi:hypothetical protein
MSTALTSAQVPAARRHGAITVALAVVLLCQAGTEEPARWVRIGRKLVVELERLRSGDATGQEHTFREDGFFVDCDEPPVLLGRDQAPNAAEYLLHALAACLTGSIVYHAAARGIVIPG